MMRIFILLFLTIWSTQRLFAQKPALDATAYDEWASFEGMPTLSNDGKFVVYGIKEGTRLYQIIQSTQDRWRFDLKNIRGSAKFSANSKYCLFTTQENVLMLINLENKKTRSIKNVSDLQVPKEGSGEWVVYKQPVNDKSLLVLMNIRTGKRRVFNGDISVTVSDNGKALVLQKKSLKKEEPDSLYWINIQTDARTLFWSGKGIQNLTVDFKHNQLAFKVNNDLLYYRIGMNSPIVLLSDIEKKENRFSLGYLQHFSQNGDRLFVFLNDKKISQNQSKKNAPEIWSYRDAKLQSVQEGEISNSENSYLAVVSLNERKIIQLQQENEHLYFTTQSPDKVLFYLNGEGDLFESWWNRTSQHKIGLVDTRTGAKASLAFLNNEYIFNPVVSPQGKYIVFYDRRKRGYFSYNIASSRIIDLTGNIERPWTINGDDSYNLRGIAAWVENDSSVLIYDNYDIWQLDLEGKKDPVNLTNGYGAKHKIFFTMFSKDPYGQEPNIASRDESFYLSGFDTENKNNGFFQTQIGMKVDPELLKMGPFISTGVRGNLLSGEFSFNPIKAKDGNTYLIRCMSATEAPNLFVTKDFKRLKRLTNYQPQKSYNWYTSELHNWDLPDGRMLKGILYKPENFDVNKKYPVIFYYYERLSDGLNAFLKPHYSEGSIDIPTYVSNGYLVFCPDIYYELGTPMQGTYNAIVSGAKYLRTLPYVNPIKMGLQGHSWGAVQTNYLITQTNLFAAACSASGTSDWVSSYGTLYGSTKNGYRWSLANKYESQGQNRMDKSLWGNLSGYIKSSPIYYVNNVSTPILLMHTKSDGICPFSNVMEFYLGLRRLGKRVWMLVYSEGSHSVFGKESEDFTLRMRQFFDHYLKDKPAPVWMLDGVAAKERDFGAGTHLDTLGRTPGFGLLTPDQQKESDSLTKKSAEIIFK